MIKKIFLFLILMFFIPFMVSAEELKMEWQKNWGGNGSDIFDFYFPLDNDNYLLVGEFASTNIAELHNNGGSDIVIVKYNKDGEIYFKKSFGGDGDDTLNYSIITSDGGILILGSSSSSNIGGLSTNGQYSNFVAKFDIDGNIQWIDVLIGSNESLYYKDYLSKVIETSSGDFIIGGSIYSLVFSDINNKGASDLVFLKYDKNGNLLWKTNWGGSSYESFGDIVQLNNDDFIVIGSFSSSDIDGLSSNGGTDAIVIKYDKDCNLLWQKSWGGNNSDSFDYVVDVSDNDFVLLGDFYSTDLIGSTENGRDSNLIFLKYDYDGNIVLQKSWGGNGSDGFNRVLPLDDGGFVAVGFLYSTDIDGLINNSNESNNDAVIVRFDNEFNVIWQKNWGGSFTESFYDIINVKDGGFIVYGVSESENIEGFNCKGYYDGIILKFDKNGNLLWQNSFGGNWRDSFNSILFVDDSSFILSGSTQSDVVDDLINLGYSDAIFIKYLIKYEFNNVESKNGKYSVDQDGSKGIVNLTPDQGYELNKIIVKDKNGKMVDVFKLEDGTYSFDLYSDVSVEVLFKEIISNPKTGVVNVIGTLLIGFIISFIGFVLVKRNCYRYDL